MPWCPLPLAQTIVFLITVPYTLIQALLEIVIIATCESIVEVTGWGSAKSFNCSSKKIIVVTHHL